MEFWKLMLVTALSGALGLGAFLAWLLYTRAREKALRPAVLTLLTANVGNASLKGLFKGFRLEDSDVPVLKQNLDALDPDLVFLQELGGPEQAGKLLDGEKYLVYFEADSCTAARRGLFTHLDPIEEYAGADGFTGCRAHFGRKNAELSLINVHAAAPLTDALFKKRGAQIRRILAEAAGIDAAGKKGVVAGDFNFDPYRFESFRHKLFDTGTKTELDLVRGKWFDMLGCRDGSLCLVSPDDHTWHVTYSFTIDHILTNLKSTECGVLNTDATRLDVNRSGARGLKEYFMDHRALFCRLEIGGRDAAPRKLRKNKRRPSGKDKPDRT